jgi:hypothetical protein
MVDIIMIFIYLLPLCCYVDKILENGLNEVLSSMGVREAMRRIKSYLTENKRRGRVWHGKKRNRRIPKTLPPMFHKMWLLQV